MKRKRDTNNYGKNTWRAMNTNRIFSKVEQHTADTQRWFIWNTCCSFKFIGLPPYWAFGEYGPKTCQMNHFIPNIFPNDYSKMKNSHRTKSKVMNNATKMKWHEQFLTRVENLKKIFGLIAIALNSKENHNLWLLRAQSKKRTSDCATRWIVNAIATTAKRISRPTNSIHKSC